MKIILNSIYDVEEFVSILSPEYVELVHASSKGCAKLGRQVREFRVGRPATAEEATDMLTRVEVIVDSKPEDAMAAATYGHDLHPEGYDPMAARDATRDIGAETLDAVRDVRTALRGETGNPVSDAEPEGLPSDIAAPEFAAVEVDATGRPWDEEIDSAAKTKTAKGIWTRSHRRDLTDERYAERAAEVLAKFQAQQEWNAPLEDEPVATETHALPTIDEATGAVAQYPFDQLIDASRKVAGDLAGDMQPLLVTARDFIGLYGTVAKDALLDAVVGGQSIPAIRDPSDRRLLQACMQNYGSFL